jgi:hypothetical protein
MKINTQDQNAKNSAHTPGPWRVSRSPDDDIMIVDRTGDTQIAILCDGDEGDNIADAHAIAAVPELLHAVTLAIAKWGKTKCTCENLPVHCPVCALRHALQKATTD